jgi:hypothetical protein
VKQIAHLVPVHVAIEARTDTELNHLHTAGVGGALFPRITGAHWRWRGPFIHGITGAHAPALQPKNLQLVVVMTA